MTLTRFKKMFPDKSRTRTDMADECDINTILGRFRKTGFTSHVNPRNPVYADFSDAGSYMESLHAVQKAQGVFDAMPARVRARVDNDPALLIAFMADEGNREEWESLGLTDKVEPEVPSVEEDGTPPAEPVVAPSE